MKRITLYLFVILTSVCINSAILNAQAERPLIIGFGNNKPPYVFEEKSSGLEVEIVQEALSHAGYKMKPFFGPMERLKLMMMDGSLDGITITNINENLKYHHSMPFIKYHNYAIVLKKKNIKIKSISDLKKYSIISFQRARDLLGEEFAKMAKENPQYKETADQKIRNIQLYKERVDVAIADKRIFEYFNTQLDSSFDVKQPIVLYDIFNVIEYQAAFRSKEVMTKFNSGLAAIKKNGIYRKLEVKYSKYK